MGDFAVQPCNASRKLLKAGGSGLKCEVYGHAAGLAGQAGDCCRYHRISVKQSNFNILVRKAPGAHHDLYGLLPARISDVIGKHAPDLQVTTLHGVSDGNRMYRDTILRGGIARIIHINAKSMFEGRLIGFVSS